MTRTIEAPEARPRLLRPIGAPRAASAPRVQEILTTPVARDWRNFYATRLLITDTISLVVAVIGAQFFLAGFSLDQFIASSQSTRITENHALASAVVILLWVAFLGSYASRDARILGTGAMEYRRILDASLLLVGLFAIAAYLLGSEAGRGYLLTAFPAGTVLLLLNRFAWRRWLRRQRRVGEYTAKVLLVGSFESATHIARELARQPEAGYMVVGAAIPTGLVAAHLPNTDIPVVGRLEHLEAALRISGADTVAITSSDELTPQRIRELSWSLEPGRQHLIVAPSLTDIGGPRIHMRPVAGLPLIHVETPRFEGRQRVQKRVFDVLGSGALIVALSPLLILTALGVRLSTPGAALFRQVRVGLNGTTFQMLKFRSMVTNAEEILANLALRERAEGNSVMFKMKNDPRITPIGSFLRRFSIDELPQLINVFRGDMSLVGPRPPLLSEVEQYEKHVHRRFLMKPGITGLWQVSGRSNLSWEDSVRLDLYYVENWSLLGDLSILWRTLRAVLARDGAY